MATNIDYLDLAISSKQKQVDLLYAKFSCKFNFAEHYHSLHHSEFPVSNSIIDLIISLAVNLDITNIKFQKQLNEINNKLDQLKGKTKIVPTTSNYIEDNITNLDKKISKILKEVNKIDTLPLEVEHLINIKPKEAFTKIYKSLEQQKKLILGDPNWNT